MKFVWGSSSSQKPREINTRLHVPVMTAEILNCILIRSQRQRRTNQSLAVHPSPFSQKLVIKESVNDSSKNQILNNTSSTMVTCTTLQTFLSLQLGKTYMPTCGRLSRWMAASRSDFYDSISTSVTNSGLKLGDMAALLIQV